MRCCYSEIIYALEFLKGYTLSGLGDKTEISIKDVVSQTEPLANGLLVRLNSEDLPVSFSEVLRGWKNDSVFRQFFNGLLDAAPYAAFRWETPPITAASANRPFEFVILDSPGLASEPDPDAFAQYFAKTGEGKDIVSFANLNNDAILVVPCPLGPLSAYSHLAAFVRKAPDAQKHSLWKAVGEQMERQFGPAPVWLSTAGAGVSWLHVRYLT